MTKYKCPACGSEFLKQTNDKSINVGIISCMGCGENYAYLLRYFWDASVDDIMYAWQESYKDRMRQKSNAIGR